MQDYSQWTMKSEHNLMSSQALFFEYLRSRLKEDEQDLKEALAQSGYIQWIDTLECVFHDSTASLNWASTADKVFLKKSFFEVFKRQKSTDIHLNLNQTFVPTVVCVVPDEQSHHILGRQGQSCINDHASYFRHHLRVGVIAESHLKKKPSLLDRVFNLKPFFELPKNLKRPSPIDLQGSLDSDLNFRQLFGSEKWKNTNPKTFAIVPAMPIKSQKTRQFTIERIRVPNAVITCDLVWRDPSPSTPNRPQDFLDALLDYLMVAGVQANKHFLVIGLKDSTGKQATACLDWERISRNNGEIHCLDCMFEGQTSVQVSSSWSVFLYAIFSTELLLASGFDSTLSFEFAKCLCVASRPIEAPPKEQLRTVVKQGHSFSDKLSFDIAHSASSHAFKFLSKLRDKHSHESIIYNRDGKELQPLGYVYSPWVSRPAFPLPTMGSPFFLLFLLSNRGNSREAHSSTGEYSLHVRKETCDGFSKALGQLGSALQAIRNSTVSKLDPNMIKKRSYLLFQWHKFIDAMSWRAHELKHIPPREVLFRTRVCSAALR
jgi:hypothetical protein